MLLNAIQAANQTLYNLSREHNEFEGMGTTLAAVYIHGEKAYIANVGDSRIYRMRASRLEQITTDHTWVNEQVRLNLMSAEAARNHRWRNVITRALGTALELQVDHQVLDLQAGDLLLLCSDGLTGMVDDGEISGALASMDGDAQATCEALCDKANDAGGDDNITMILLQITE